MLFVQLLRRLNHCIALLGPVLGSPLATQLIFPFHASAHAGDALRKQALFDERHDLDRAWCVCPSAIMLLADHCPAAGSVVVSLRMTGSLVAPFAAVL
jgi:hypothetical protein